MIYLGYRDGQKLQIVRQYASDNGIARIVVISPREFSLPVEGADLIEWKEVIMYRTFYRLLQEIDGSTLIVINECLRTQNRYDLTYNCIRNFLNQTAHQIVFQYLPQIDGAEDFMILFDLVTQSRWKREPFDPNLVQANAKIFVNPVCPSFAQIPITVSDRTQKKYIAEREKLFANLGTSDPHTLPRNLYLVGGQDKARHIDPFRQYVARNQRIKIDNLFTYDQIEQGNTYTILEFPHRFIDFADFLTTTRQTHVDVMVTDLKVDQWYWDRYQAWGDRIHATYTSLQ